MFGKPRGPGPHMGTVDRRLTIIRKWSPMSIVNTTLRLTTKAACSCVPDTWAFESSEPWGLCVYQKAPGTLRDGGSSKICEMF